MHPRPADPARLVPAPTLDAPRQHHLDYFVLHWRGFDKQNQPLPNGHPWKTLRRTILIAFTEGAAAQAQAMGLLDDKQKFIYHRPDRNQYVGVDGVVMPLRQRKTGLSSCGLYPVGGGKQKVYGSKYTVFSTRIDGQYMSRVILDFLHTGKDANSRAINEPDAILQVAPELRRLTKGGMKGLLVDSVLRGENVTTLQRQGIRVVNYPHAAANPDGGAGKRLNTTRGEKSHFRTIATHELRNGRGCNHPIYALGGELVTLVTNDHGEPDIGHLPHDGYERRANKDGSHREYATVTIHCTLGGDISHSVALFHTDGTSGDPRYNWGEVVRVYPPSSPEFKYLYGARNDTEARHSDLKARVKNLPGDVAGQERRLLGAAIAINTAAWQVHLQAHGEPHVIDDTA